MYTELKFLEQVNSYMGIDVSITELEVPLVNLANWDSLNAIRLMAQLENSLGRRLPISRYLQATTLRQIYDLTCDLAAA